VKLRQRRWRAAPARQHRTTAQQKTWLPPLESSTLTARLYRPTSASLGPAIAVEHSSGQRRSPRYRVLAKQQPAPAARPVALRYRGPSRRESRSSRAAPRPRARGCGRTRKSARHGQLPPDDCSCVGACRQRASQLGICEAAARPAEVAPDELEICAVPGNWRRAAISASPGHVR
jgi:hypothetical protein